MRKLSSIALLATVAFFFASCGGGGLEGDVKKMAKKSCECMEMMTGETPDEEGAEKCFGAMEELGESMEEKYGEELEGEKGEEMRDLMTKTMKEECPEAAEGMPGM